MATDEAIAREAFENAATIMVVLDADGVVRRINDRGCQVLGYDRSELEGTDWFETIVPDASDVGLAEVMGRVRSGEECDVHENTVRTGDGEIRWIKWHVAGLRDDDGTVTDLLVSGSDVTDRVETERRLRRYEQAIESSTNLLAAIDQDYTYVLTNRRYRDFYGIEGTIADERSVADVLDPEQFAEVKSYIDRALAGETLEYDTDRVDRDGNERAFHVRYFPLEAEDGTIQGAVAALQDVTERRERERARAEAKDTFEGIFHAINDAVFVHDFEGQFLAVNETACDRLGYDEAELLEMTPWELDAADRAEEIDERFETIRREGELTFETVHVAKDGTKIPVEITASSVTYFGTEAILSVARDITDRKERSRQLRREVERLEEFASVISHDLRNPLNVAQGRLALLSEEIDSDHIEPIDRSLDRMEAIIEDTLTLARQGKTVGETEAVAIADVIGQCWESVATGGATLSFDEQFTIRADRDRLRHVFENLFRNAVTHGGPEVTVRIGRTDSGFYVEDDGAGIPDGDRESIFEPGYTTVEGGTGFGLTIVRQIAEAHGWTVTATAGTDGGARFEFDGVDIVA